MLLIEIIYNFALYKKWLIIYVILFNVYNIINLKILVKFEKLFMKYVIIILTLKK